MINMLESDDAVKIVETIAKNLIGVSKNQSNFQKLPDNFWGYYARGHDSKGKFGVIVTYSEEGSDIDNLIKLYEDWVTKNKSENQEP